MTNTEEIELELCFDCALIIANDDDSGVEDPEAHREAIAGRWGDGAYRLVVTECEFFSHSRCDGCGGPPGDRIRGVALPER